MPGRCANPGVDALNAVARNVDHILTRSLLPELSAAILSRIAAAEPVEYVGVTVDDRGEFAYEIR